MPNLIKITPEDAVELKDEDLVVDTKHPVIILIEDENKNLILNATDGTVLELDFSDLPQEPEQRSNELKWAQRPASFVIEHAHRQLCRRVGGQAAKAFRRGNRGAWGGLFGRPAKLRLPRQMVSRLGRMSELHCRPAPALWTSRS